MRSLSKLITSGCLIFIVGWVSQVEGSKSITLAWDPDADPSVTGYRLYSGTSSGVYTQTIDVGNNTSALLSNLSHGKTYYFVVTAYNAAAAESSPSNEVSYIVPAVASNPTPTPASKLPPALPAISLTAAPSSVNKGGVATYTASATITNPSQPIIVGFAMGGKATLGSDYTLSANRITIPAGQSSASVTLQVITTKTKGKEKATMSLQPGTGYAIKGKKKAAVTIQNQ